MPQARKSERWKGGAGRPRVTAALLALSVALGGCNAAIATYRNMRGLSKNDPNPATTPNTKNLAIAEAEPYPNLASVPPPPTGVSTAAEREQMLKSLTASRVTLDATAQKLRAEAVLAFAAPPPPLPPRTAMAAAAGNPPAMPGAKPRSGSSLGKPGQPPVPGPLESRLVSPRIAPLPQPEASRPAPSAPHLTVTLVPGPAALPSIAGPPRGPSGSIWAAPGGAALAAAGFRPPPPPPLLAPPQSMPPGTPPGKPKPPIPAAAIKLAEIRFPADATRLAAGDRPIVAQVAALYRHRPGTLRVVGFAGGGGGARRQLASFRAALDRAQAVAAALEQAGIPAAKVKIEAAPTGAEAGEARAEIMLQP